LHAAIACWLTAGLPGAIPPPPLGRVVTVAPDVVVEDPVAVVLVGLAVDVLVVLVEELGVVLLAMLLLVLLLVFLELPPQPATNTQLIAAMVASRQILLIIDPPGECEARNGRIDRIRTLSRWPPSQSRGRE
jgi:hypothetical protein